MSSSSKVARFIEHFVNVSPKSQKQIAKECGFPYANVLSMIKNGDTKLPLARVTATARALDVDAAELLVMCLEEYEPELWQTLRQVLPGVLLAKRDLVLLETIRKHFVP